MLFPPLLMIALTAATAGVSAKTITRVVDWPGYKTERACVQTALRQPTSAVYIGCTEYVCACNHFDVALSLVSSAARETCISANDVAAATSIIKGFCYQFPGVTASIPVCKPHAPLCSYMPERGWGVVGRDVDGRRPRGL
jgi:hypothetical protein